ncbi:MAG: membrane protein insertion efficiency factor YidD [Candidatus Bathyarchaeia archaeon]
MNVASRTMITFIRAYQKLISSWMPPRCRFYPSCSQYTAQAIEAYGPLKGMWLGVKRISRCHPWNEGGFDPLPEK